MAGLMQQAAAGAPKGKPFTPPDAAKIVQPQMKDAVDRIVAAGMKLMFSPVMKDERLQAVQSPDPIPKKLAENVTGLILTLDKQSKGGLPVEAIFPAAVMLLSEAAEVLKAAGQDVSEDDYLDAVRMLFVLLGKKMGGTDEQIMQAARQALPPGAQDDEAQEPGPQDPQEAAIPPQPQPQAAPMPQEGV